jgi:hypothetical protein
MFEICHAVAAGVNDFAILNNSNCAAGGWQEAINSNAGISIVSNLRELNFIIEFRVAISNYPKLQSLKHLSKI